MIVDRLERGLSKQALQGVRGSDRQTDKWGETGETLSEQEDWLRNRGEAHSQLINKKHQKIDVFFASGS